MRSNWRKSAIGLLVCGSAGLLGSLFLFGSTVAVGAAKVPAKTTTIVVQAGKPSELAFKLSRTSLIPAGTVIFKVTNAGRIPHDFEICLTATTRSTAPNTCKPAKSTALLQPGKSVTLTVKLTKNGTYAYLCTLPGHASAGMKGLIGIGVKVKAPAPPKTTTTTTTTTTPVTTTPVTTTPATTTTAAPPPTTTSSSGGGTDTLDDCPTGKTIPTSGNTDGDDDDTGAQSDGDGCI